MHLADQRVIDEIQDLARLSSIHCGIRHAGLWQIFTNFRSIDAIKSGRRRSARGQLMVTIFDWVSIILFSGIAVLYLQRSAQPEPSDKVWHYIAPAVGCALVNYLGNHDHPAGAALLTVLTLIYVYFILKPLGIR